MGELNQAASKAVPKQPRIAILDDYQGVARSVADWSSVEADAEIVVFTDHVSDEDRLVERLHPFDIVCVMRERTPLGECVLQRLPGLKLIASTGLQNRSIDLDAATRLGIEVVHTGYSSTPTIELTWALILAIARRVTTENASLRAGGWQRSLGSDIRGKTLGLLGLGHVGSGVAAIGRAFGMNLIAWSQNLTAEHASAAGAELVSKEELLRRADYLSVHLVLSQRTRGVLGLAELSLMKPTAYLINTSRGPLVEETALIEILESKRIAGAAIDVYDVEPLPADHPFRSLQNLLATPHIGYVSRALYETFYQDTVKNIASWLIRRGPQAHGPG